MTRDKQILVGVVVLAALGGLVFMQVKKDQSIGKTTGPQAVPTYAPAAATSTTICHS